MRLTVKSGLRAAAVLMLAVAGIQLAAVAPTSASPGLIFASGMSPLDSAVSKEAAAVCPTGTRVLGGGGFVEGGGRRVVFQRLQASGSFDTFFAGAIEAGNYTGNWRVHAYAICADQPSGLTYVSFGTSTNSDSFKTATASCTGNRKVISAGARVGNGDGQVFIDDMAPNGSLTSVTATAYEDQTGYADNWDLSAFAVCADPLAGHEFRTATSAVNSSDKVATIACPAGKKVHGLGAKINGTVGEAFHGGVYPSAALTSGTAITIEDADGYNNNWTNSVFVICAF